MDDSAYAKNAQPEQSHVEGQSYAVELLRDPRFFLTGLAAPAEDEYAYGDKDEREGGVGEHEPQEVRDLHLIVCEQIKVLRIAYGGHHAAEVGCDGEHYQGEHQLFVVTELTEHGEGKGDDGHEGDVVCEEHRKEECKYHEQHRDASCGLYFREEFGGQVVEGADPYHGADGEHKAEQDRQHAEIDVADV